MPSRDWRFRVEDILDAIAKIHRFTAKHDLASFQQDDMAVDAVVRNFQVVGEAARHIPPDVQVQHPEIPWAKMREMRHFLVHVYFEISVPILWKTAKEDLPPLVPLLCALVRSGDQ